MPKLRRNQWEILHNINSGFYLQLNTIEHSCSDFKLNININSGPAYAVYPLNRSLDMWFSAIACCENQPWLHSTVSDTGSSKQSKIC